MTSLVTSRRRFYDLHFLPSLEEKPAEEFCAHILVHSGTGPGCLQGLVTPTLRELPGLYTSYSGFLLLVSALLIFFQMLKKALLGHYGCCPTLGRMPRGCGPTAPRQPTGSWTKKRTVTMHYVPEHQEDAFFYYFHFQLFSSQCLVSDT